MTNETEIKNIDNADQNEQEVINENQELYVVEDCNYNMDDVKHFYHFFLQNKGGIGKTTICSFFCQYLGEKKQPRIIYDVDPQNKSLLSYKSLNAETFVFSENNQSDLFKIENLFAMLETDEKFINQKTHVIFDIGTSGYNDFYNTLITNGNIANILYDEKNEVIIHAIIGSGNEQTNDCILGLRDIIEHTNHIEKLKIVIWVNRYWGEFCLRGANNVITNRIENAKIYKDLKERNRSLGIIYLPVLQNVASGQEVYARELRDMVNNRNTFQDVIDNCDVSDYKSRQSKIRALSWKDVIFESIDPVLNKIMFPDEK